MTNNLHRAQRMKFFFPFRVWAENGATIGQSFHQVSTYFTSGIFYLARGENQFKINSSTTTKQHHKSSHVVIWVVICKVFFLKTAAQKPGFNPHGSMSKEENIFNELAKLCKFKIHHCPHCISVHHIRFQDIAKTYRKFFHPLLHQF